MKRKKEVQDILLQTKEDRRKLANVRAASDRRGDGRAKYGKSETGTRYSVDYKVKLTAKVEEQKIKIEGKARDISTTGMLLEVTNTGAYDFQTIRSVRAVFEIIEGSMPEGYEMKVNVKAKIVRVKEENGDKLLLGLEFEQTLSQYANRKRGRYAMTVASMLLFVVCAFIILMRAESVIYFKFNRWLYLYSIVAAAFLLSRYLFGAGYRAVPIDEGYTPGVSIIIPCFNEREWIQRTIVSCINQDYPMEKLEVIVVDDHSTDGSPEKIREIIEELRLEGNSYGVEERLRYVVQEQNRGKREALCKGVVLSRHDLVVFVDSDSFLDPFAIRNLVQPFQDEKMGGVSGRTDVANTYTNALTKMQSVRYYISFRIMKAAESYFDGVTCLSGPLACYRKQIILENMEAWLHQTFLGQKATFGDDRSMTNFVLKKHRTGYQDTAVCSTIVPNQHKVFLKQQMRWKRSWLRESIVAAKFMWKKEPFMAVFFYIGIIVPIAAPVVVLYNLLWIPVVQGIFPKTFLTGLLLMALLMSIVQLFLRKSRTWLFGLLFCFYYEAVLLWQMPVAWFTFWKSTWGTRMTPEDLKERAKYAKTQAESEQIMEEQSKETRVPENIMTLGRQADALIEECMKKKEGEEKTKRHFFMQRKDWKKAVRGIEEAGILLFLVFVFISNLVNVKKYMPYEEGGITVSETQDTGFVALSYFGVDRSEHSSLISTKRLKEHIRALYSSGYVTVTQEDIWEYYKTGKRLPEKALFLMYEDGRRDTAVFSEKIMEDYNYIATMMTYAKKLDGSDRKFLTVKDLQSLENSSFWEMGSNGYRWELINHYEQRYTHYLMDYIRDEYGIPLENGSQMKERISGDYDKLRTIYTEGIGRVPAVYALMHSNTGQFGENKRVSAVNESRIKELFSMNFNREGDSLNTADSSVYDLTRLQPREYWSANHLLMRIWDDTRQEMAWVDGDEEQKSEWAEIKGKAEFTRDRIILTSEPSHMGLLCLKQQAVSDVSIETILSGREYGEQNILLRADIKEEKYLAVKRKGKLLSVSEKKKGREKELFSCELENAERPEIKLLLKADKLTILVNGKTVLAEQKVELLEPGAVLLQSVCSETVFTKRKQADDVYDGVFEQLVIMEETDIQGKRVLCSLRPDGMERVAVDMIRTWENVLNWFIETF